VDHNALPSSEQRLWKIATQREFTAMLNQSLEAPQTEICVKRCGRRSGLFHGSEMTKRITIKRS